MPENHPLPGFQPFDPNAPFDATVSRNLPHWFQPGAATFITFRTNDSLPREVVLRWRRELEAWLRARQLPVELAIPVTDRAPIGHEERLARLDPAVQWEFRTLKSRLFHRALDECRGACLLRCQDLSAVVAETMLHGDGVTHDIDCLVVMPNHVHVLAQFREGTDRSVVGHRWMRYSARKINRLLGQRGSFWQPEPFDHLVRNAESFEGYQNYIASNPARAGLSSDECRFWCRDL